VIDEALATQFATAELLWKGHDSASGSDVTVVNELIQGCYSLVDL